MKINITRHERKRISDYPEGFILDVEVKNAEMIQGNWIVMDRDNRLYNCHPRTDLYIKETGSAGFPVRWQITSLYDLDELGYEYKEEA